MPHDTTCPVCGGALPDMPLTLLPERGLVVANGACAALTGKEAAVLQVLVERWPNVVAKEAIIAAIYAVEADEPDWKIVDVFVCKMRGKLREIGVEIETHWGRGYSLGVTRRPDVAA